MTLSLTSSCSRCVRKLWWGWVGWGWRQILPPHRRSARLREREGGKKKKKRRTMIHRLIYLREVRRHKQSERERSRRGRAVNHRAAVISGVNHRQIYCSQTKWDSAAEIYGPIIHSRETTWGERSGADLCCPLAGGGRRCYTSHNISIIIITIIISIITFRSQFLTVEEGLCGDEEGSGAHPEQSD